MDHFSIEYLSFREAPLELERLKEPCIVLEVLAKGYVVADMQKLQQDYERTLNRELLRKITQHPLHAIVINEIEFYFLMTGQYPYELSKQQQPQQPMIFQAVFC